ncbi:MAG: tetratricopeptide repeat protein, partial [Syntrophothermus sp.]
MNYKYLFFLVLISLHTSFLMGQTGDLFNRFRLGQSYEQAGDIQKAKSVFEGVYRQQPDNFQFFDALNRVYTQLKEYDNSIAIIEARLKLTPQDINLYGLLGTTWYLKGDENKASSVWEDGIKLFPDKAVAYRVIANYAIERRAFDQAVNILKRAQKLQSADSYNFSYDIANIYSMLMKYREAAEEFCSILEKDPSQMSLIQARLAQITGKPDALKEISEVVEKKADENGNINMLVLLGWLYMEGGRYKDAYGIYLKIDSANKGSGSELFNFAERALKEGYYEEASSAYKRIFTSYPSSPFVPGAKIGFARTIEATADKKASTDSENWKPFYAVSTKDKGLYGEVIAAYEDLIKQYDGLEVALEAHFRLGTIKLDRLDDLSGAEAEFKKVTDYSLNSPFSVNAFARLAEISVRKDNLPEAAGYYDKIPECPAAKSSDKNLASFMKARIRFWQGNFSDASMLLSGVESNYNENNTNDAIELSLLINTTK